MFFRFGVAEENLYQQRRRPSLWDRELQTLVPLFGGLLPFGLGVSGFGFGFRDIHTILGGPLPYIRVYRALGFGFRLVFVLKLLLGGTIPSGLGCRGL